MHLLNGFEQFFSRTIQIRGLKVNSFYLASQSPTYRKVRISHVSVRDDDVAMNRRATSPFSEKEMRHITKSVYHRENCKVISRYSHSRHSHCVSD